MGNFPYIKIDKFRGINKPNDPLSLLPGQLSKNTNYLYLSNGGLEERGGGAELSANPAGGTDPVFSLSNYITPNGTNYLITNQDATVYYYNSGWQDLSMSLTADLKIRWEGAGFEANRALYGTNGTDSIIKILGNTPVASLVSNSPTDAIHLKTHKNRLFACNNKDTLYFTEALDFNTWNTTVNTIEVAPGIDGGIQALEVWGDALFIFKESGVYVLPNADDPVPSLNWVVLRSDALTGTQSTGSVKRTPAGIAYLATDNHFRLIGTRVSFSSGEFTLGDSGSPIISYDIDGDLNTLLDQTTRDQVEAKMHGDLYIFTAQSSTNAQDNNDLSYFADMKKFNKHPDIAQPQPFWGEFDGFDYDFMTTQISGTTTKFYGAKGLSGSVQEVFNNSVHNDAGAAISSKAILGWLPIGGDGLLKKIRQIYFSGETESWNISLNFNGFRLGSSLPGEGEGYAVTFTTNNQSGGKVGSAIVGTDTVGSSGAGSGIFRMGIRAHYFTAEFGNCNADEFTRILNLIIYYRPLKQS